MTQIASINVDNISYTLMEQNNTTQIILVGEQGLVGPRGLTGKSAYQSAVELGYSGTEADWINQVNLAQGTLASAQAAAATATAKAAEAVATVGTIQQAAADAETSKNAAAGSVTDAAGLLAQTVAAKNAAIAQADIATTKAGDAAAAAGTATAQANIATTKAAEAAAGLASKLDTTLAGAPLGLAQLDNTGVLKAEQVPPTVALKTDVASVTVKEEGTSITTSLKSLNFVGTSVKATNAAGDVTVTVDSVSVVNCAFSMTGGIVSGKNLVLSLSGSAGLQGQSIAAFEVTDWNGTVHTGIAAVGNAASYSQVATGAVGTVLSLSAVAIDTAGNRSAAVTHTTTIVNNSAPSGTPVVSAPTQIAKTASGTMSISGVQDTDGTAWSYSIYQDPAQPFQLSFSKTTGIQPGEVITVTAPDTTGVTSDPTITFSVHAVDELGAQGVSTSVSILILASTVVGVVLKATGGNGGTWGHIDVAGNDITSPATSWFNSYGPYLWQAVTVAGRSMIKIPKFYFKVGVISGGANNGKTAYWISDLPRAGFAVHPAFMKNGVEISQFYIDATATSFSTTSVTAARTSAAALNTGGVTGFQVLNFWQWSAVMYALLVELKTMASVEPIKPAASTNYRGLALCASGTIQFIVDGIYIDASGNINVLDTSGNGTYVNAGAAALGAFATTGGFSGSYQGSYVDSFVTTGPLAGGFIASTSAVLAANATSPGGVAHTKPGSGITCMAVPWRIDGVTSSTVGDAFSYTMTVSDSNTNLGILRCSKT